MPILSLRTNWQAGVEWCLLLFRHRQLTWEMTRREVTDRYAGQVLGLAWAFGHPFILFAVYIFVFVFVFASRLGETGGLPRDYAAYLLSGLVPWMACLESLNKGTTALTANANLVKQVVFPIEILPVKCVLAGFFTQLIAMVLLAAYILVQHHGLPWTWSLVPLLFVLQFFALAGMVYVLAAVGAYFRDIKEMVQVFGVVGVYLVPVVYMPNMVPEVFRYLLYLNPFSYLIWCYQDACYFGRFEHPWAWGVLTVFSLLSCALGYRTFRYLKSMFGNVL